MKSGFTDLAGHWAQQEIERLSQRGLLQGCGDGLFAPNRSVTRAEFTEMLARFLALPKGEHCPFTDVGQDAWYRDSIVKTYTAGLIKGMDDKTFNPDALLTREQMAVISSGVLNLKNEKTTGDLKLLDRFKDKNRISPWAADACARMVEKDILKGDSGYLKPDAGATRAEAAVLLSRICE